MHPLLTQFDYGAIGAAGLEGFARNVSDAFPILSCNLDVSGEPALAGLVQPFALIDLPVSGLTVGVVGLTPVDTAETSNPGGSVKFLPYNETLPNCAAAAREAGADLVIALTHIGFDVDQELAASEAGEGVDLFVGGHTHTLQWGAPAPAGEALVAGVPPPVLVSPPTNETTAPQGPYPTAVLNAATGRAMPVAQALYGGRYLGLLDVALGADGRVAAVSGAPVLLGGKNSTNPVEDDAVAAARLAELKVTLDAYNGVVVGASAVVLDGEREDIRNRETNLGDLACEAVMQVRALRLLPWDGVGGMELQALPGAGDMLEGRKREQRGCLRLALACWPHN